MAEEKTLVPRLKVRYQEEIRNSLKDKFEYENVNQIPGDRKSVV